MIWILLYWAGFSTCDDDWHGVFLYSSRTRGLMALSSSMCSAVADVIFRTVSWPGCRIMELRMASGMVYSSLSSSTCWRPSLRRAPPRACPRPPPPPPSCALARPRLDEAPSRARPRLDEAPSCALPRLGPAPPRARSRLCPTPSRQCLISGLLLCNQYNQYAVII